MSTYLLVGSCHPRAKGQDTPAATGELCKPLPESVSRPLPKVEAGHRADSLVATRLITPALD